MMPTVEHDGAEGGTSYFSRAARWIGDSLSRIFRFNSANPNPSPNPVNLELYRDTQDIYYPTMSLVDTRMPPSGIKGVRAPNPLSKSIVQYDETGRGTFGLSRVAKWIRGALSRSNYSHLNPKLVQVDLYDDLYSDLYGDLYNGTCQYRPTCSTLSVDCGSYEILRHSNIRARGHEHAWPLRFGSIAYKCDYGEYEHGCESPIHPFNTPLDITVHDEVRRGQDTIQILSELPESKPACHIDGLVGNGAFVTAVNYSGTNSQPNHCQLHGLPSGNGSSGRDFSCLSHSVSIPSLSHVIPVKNKTWRAQSLPNMVLQTSYEDFTPDITDEENNQSYSFQCSRPGLYQCRATGVLFHMEKEGDVVYSIVPWDRRLLAQHHKKPAGPLFDIKCAQQSLCQLHLPHCEASSTGGSQFLSVAHVITEGIEFITPHKITDTHVIINITGLSGFGNVKDEDSPPDPVRALVLLFYRPPNDPDVESLINVLLLPKNISLRNLQCTREKLVGSERYIETSPHCKLRSDQTYTLSTCLDEDSVQVEPTEAEFYCDDYDNFFPSFQVVLKKSMKHIKLVLRDPISSRCVWERQVCLSSPVVKGSCWTSPLNLPSHEKLLDIRSNFIDTISGPVLKSLLDKLLEKKVITDSERELAEEMQNRGDKARFVIDTVRKKGEAASSEMIEFLCEVDPFLCEHLGLV